jgi:RNA polymerase-binding transcription factor DksA
MSCDMPETDGTYGICLSDGEPIESVTLET